MPPCFRSLEISSTTEYTHTPNTAPTLRLCDQAPPSDRQQDYILTPLRMHELMPEQVLGSSCVLVLDSEASACVRDYYYSAIG